MIPSTDKICPDCGGNELKRDNENSFFIKYNSIEELNYGYYECYDCGRRFQTEPERLHSGEPVGIVII